MPADYERPRRRRGRRGLTVLVILAAGGAVAAVTLSRYDSSQAADRTTADLPPNTAKVTRQTLRDTQAADGELGYGTTTALTNRLLGTLTKLPDSGQQITRGQALYSVNDEPVTLMYGKLPAYRKLADGSEGPDVEQLEQNLRVLGYTGFTVNDEYTYATAEAVQEWQQDLGVEETGTVELGQVVFAPAPVRVDTLSAQEGEPTSPGQKVLTFTGTAKAVAVQLDASDLRLAKKGSRVTVTLPDDSTVAGTIDEVSTIIDPGSGQNDDPQTKVEVVVALDNQKAAAGYALASVKVTFTAAERQNVLTVPVAALLALQEGGFGVEVTDGSTSHYVPVKAGLFADGQVEISGAGIAQGTTVGVPK